MLLSYGNFFLPFGEMVVHINKYLPPSLTKTTPWYKTHLAVNPNHFLFIEILDSGSLKMKN